MISSGDLLSPRAPAFSCAHHFHAPARQATQKGEEVADRRLPCAWLAVSADERKIWASGGKLSKRAKTELGENLEN